MKTYVSFLKILGILFLIPLGLALIVILGYIGFALDFNNAWSNKSTGNTGSIYILLLPLSFVALTGWVIYATSKRKAARRIRNQELAIRQQVYREQDLGTNAHDIVVNILRKQGGKTVIELSQILSNNQEETLSIIRQLLQSRRIRQDSSLQPSRFYAL